MQEIKRLHANDRMSQAVIYSGATVPNGAAPARPCIESHMARRDIRVEIQVVAAA
jgi:enamine deaminase RidA (YjgF/YER057c/UK114 family)